MGKVSWREASRVRSSSGVRFLKSRPKRRKPPGCHSRASSSQPVSGKRTQNSWPAFSSGVMVSTMAWSSSSWVGGSGSGAG